MGCSVSRRHQRIGPTVSLDIDLSPPCFLATSANKEPKMTNLWCMSILVSTSHSSAGCCQLYPLPTDIWSDFLPHFCRSAQVLRPGKAENYRHDRSRCGSKQSYSSPALSMPQARTMTSSRSAKTRATPEEQELESIAPTNKTE